MERRQQILATAGALFREHGYHATSMRDIAGTLDLRGSSLYAHIGSKEEVLAELVHRAADAFRAQADATRALGPEVGARERLERFVRGHLAVIAEHLPTATVFFHEWRFLSEPLRSEVVARRDAYERALREIVEAGAAEGVFRVTDVALATRFALGALNWTYQWIDPAGPLEPDALAARYTELVLNALGAVPPGQEDA